MTQHAVISKITRLCACSCPTNAEAVSPPRHDSSLTDRQREVLRPPVPQPDPRRGGRPGTYPTRLVIDSILSVLRTGCAWRILPHDLVPGNVAYRWFEHWTAAGVWHDVHETLRDRLRIADGRGPALTVAVLDAPRQ